MDLFYTWFFRIFVVVWLVWGILLAFSPQADAHWKPGIHNHQHAVQKYFGPYWREAWEVSLCESDYFPRDGKPDTIARNGQYRGMFQMGSGERKRWGHGPDPWSQAKAAARYFWYSLKVNGYRWGPWECKPW
jgi:hypothetical protein